MFQGVCFGFSDMTFVFLLLLFVTGSQLTDHRRHTEDDRGRNKAILEMLHINKVSASHEAKPHPYMRGIYHQLDSLEAEDFGDSDETVVQSFRSIVGPHEAPSGWIWFNASGLNPSILAAELVMYRKTLYPNPISITVALHTASAFKGTLVENPVMEERQLTLDQQSSSGYDVFDVSAVMLVKPLEVLGFQLRYTDETGSLVLHEALTQSLYCVKRGSLKEPLLVLYQSHLLHS